MNRKKLQSKKWYDYAVALCIGVVLFVALTHIDIISKYVGTFVGFFKPVILGCVIAYIVSPLANMYKNRLFGRIENKKAKESMANILAFVTILLFLVALLRVMIPQLVDSVTLFASNLDTYIAAVTDLLGRLGLSESAFGLKNIPDGTGEIMRRISAYVTKNTDQIMKVSANIGKGAFNWVIALILSIYMLSERENLKKGFKYLLNSMMSDRAYAGVADFLKHCDRIFNRYIVFNLIDAVIVAMLNLIFMTVMGLPYAGLVSFVVGVTNLIPTFGPFIGGAIGAVILLLVKPWYAGAFLLFTLAVQIFDGYMLKPKLFGSSLGVSSLWILIAIIVGGNMFGVIGILLSIPTIAILDDIYHEYLLPALRRRKERAAEEEG